MKKVILLLFIQDEAYGKRLLRFLAGKKNPSLYPELITEREHLKKKNEFEDKELVVLTDDAGIKENDRRKVIYLSGEGVRTNNRIFMYQRADGLYQDLLEILKLQRHSGGIMVKKGLFCLLDPGGDSSALAVLLSQYLGKQGKCLYLNLTGFPLYYGSGLEEEPKFSERGLGELFFCMDEEHLAEHVSALAKPFGYAEMMAPFPHFKDLLDCGIREWDSLLLRLRKECGYDSIVIQLGQLFEYTLGLMAQSEFPCLIGSTDLCGRIRTAVFRQYCRLEQKEQLITSCHIVQNPIGGEPGMSLLSNMTPEEIGADTALMAQAERWLEEVGREDGSDIIYSEDEGEETAYSG